MPEEKPRLARLTAIMTQLQSKKIVTATYLAEKHQVSVRTIYRDIRTLELSGVPIVTEEGRGYSMMEGYHLPPVMFKEEEANAIITAQKIIAQNNDQSLVKEYNNAADKIKAVLRDQQKDNTELLSARMEVRIPKAEENLSNYLMPLQKAITHFEIVQINYLSLSKKVSIREIEPFALIHTQNNWVLIAYCRLRQDFRVFRLDCIQNIQISTSHFVPHKITLEEYYKIASKNWT